MGTSKEEAGRTVGEALEALAGERSRRRKRGLSQDVVLLVLKKPTTAARYNEGPRRAPFQHGKSRQEGTSRPSPWP